MSLPLYRGKHRLCETLRGPSMNFPKPIAYLLLALLLGWESSALAVDDPFAPYLNSASTVVQTLSQTNSGSGASAITTKELTLSSRGGANVVFGIEVFPQQAGAHRGVLLLHGGG